MIIKSNPCFLFNLRDLVLIDEIVSAGESSMNSDSSFSFSLAFIIFSKSITWEVSKEFGIKKC